MDVFDKSGYDMPLKIQIPFYYSLKVLIPTLEKCFVLYSV